jgi:hypothetical protein
MTPRVTKAARQPGTHNTPGSAARSAGSPPQAEYRVRARVWLYAGAGGWHFANLSERQSHEIKGRFGENRRGWGAVPVTIRIGRTIWRTSLFPDRKSATYLFAIKAEVRREEGISVGDTIRAIVQIR